MSRHTDRIRRAIGEIDAALKDDAVSAASSAHAIMHRFDTANMVERVDAFVLGQSKFDLRRHIKCAMGQKLGHFIAEKIDFTSKTAPDTDMTRYLRPHGTVEFRAEVYVLTPEQFKAALDEAYRAGR